MRPTATAVSGGESLSRNGIVIALLCARWCVRRSYRASYYARGINTATIIARYIRYDRHDQYHYPPCYGGLRNSDSYLSILELCLHCFHTLSPRLCIPAFRSRCLGGYLIILDRLRDYRFESTRAIGTRCRKLGDTETRLPTYLRVQHFASRIHTHTALAAT